MRQAVAKPSLRRMYWSAFLGGELEGLSVHLKDRHLELPQERDDRIGFAEKVQGLRKKHKAKKIKIKNV